jgi:phage terminase large subunit-like protein
MSLALRRLPPEQARRALVLGALAARARAGRGDELPIWAPEAHQVPPPGDWLYWLLVAGRRAGKTAAGTHYVDAHARGPACTPDGHRIAIIAPTRQDAKNICVVGETGLLAANPAIVFRPGGKTADLVWPGRTAVASLFGAYTPQDPERLRGPQHCLVWAEEFAAWRFMEPTWQMARLGLRLGARPHAVFTTTPRPAKTLVALMADPHAIVTSASTFDNPHLPKSAVDELTRLYANSRIGLQELYAKILADVEGALWHRGRLDALRVTNVPELRRIVVAIDPAASDNADSDETGIIVDGIDELPEPHGYTLDDLSLRGSPHDWASAAIAAYHKWSADLIVAEANNGGDMIDAVIHAIDLSVPVKLVHASRDKHTRAEPISTLYDQGRWHHVGFFGALEDQLCGWDPRTDRTSPDRLDAHVWAATELLVDPYRNNPWALIKGPAGGVA